MIPEDREDLDVLAGEYVLGLVDPKQSREIAAALATHIALKDAVSFWEQNLYPLSALAPKAEPPAGTWDAIAARLDDAASPISAAPRWGSRAAPWQWSTAGFAAAAAALLVYIVLAPTAPAPPLFAALHAPREQNASWVATLGRDGLRLTAVARETPPAARVFELWAIAAHAARPEPLGVIPAGGRLRLAHMPGDVRLGATLAISIEPPGGSPTGLPTGPIAFTGALRSI